MKFGLALPQTAQYDLRLDVPAVAKGAETLGCTSLWAYERSLFPLRPKDGMYGIPGLPWSDSYRSTAEPLTVLTLAAAVTSTVRLGTCVLVAGLHPAHRLAKTFATLDRATGGGRVVAGLGSGWSRDEFEAFGAPFEDRGRDLEETLDALTALWGEDPVTYRDARTRIDDALISPKPLGRIPVLIGGGPSPKVLDRIARKADGWIPAGLPLPVVAQQWERLRELAVGHGRAEGALQLVPLMTVILTDAEADSRRMPFQGSVAQVVSDAAELAEIGAGECIIAVADAASGPDLMDKAATLMAALGEQGLRAE